MSEWFKEHAWKSDRFTRADAHRIPPTHVRSISSRYNEVPRDAPVSEDVHRGFRGVCDTVLTQKLNALRRCQPVRQRTSPSVLNLACFEPMRNVLAHSDGRRPAAELTENRCNDRDEWLT